MICMMADTVITRVLCLGLGSKSRLDFRHCLCAALTFYFVRDIVGQDIIEEQIYFTFSFYPI